MAGNLLTLDEAARVLGIAPAQLKAMHDRNEVVNVRGSSGLMFKREEIDRVADEHGLGGGNALGAEPAAENGSSLSFSLADDDDSPSSIAFGSDLDLAGSSLSSDPAKSAPLVEDDDLLLGAGEAASGVLGDEGGNVDDDSLVLEDLAGSALSSGDSGINLTPDDSGIDLEGAASGSAVTPGVGDSGLGSSILDAGLGSSILDEGVVDFEAGGSVAMPASGPAPGGDDFQLTAGPGGDVDEESSSQVIALDDPAGFGGGGLDAGGMGGFPAQGLDGGFGGPALMDQGMDGGYGMAPAAVAQPTVIVAGPSERPYSIFSVLGLLLVLGIMVPAGLLMIDLVAVMRGTDMTEKMVGSGLADTLWDSSKSVLESIFG